MRSQGSEYDEWSSEGISTTRNAPWRYICHQVKQKSVCEKSGGTKLLETKHGEHQRRRAHLGRHDGTGCFSFVPPLVDVAVAPSSFSLVLGDWMTDQRK
jgi:hypothetical protein